ncbi:UbiA family prenyltransferase [Haloactinopolyspora sp.]|uniref:UbiA family prenyltransferase n=1 Tax=Haloactinopolyspora sp. TaxID=1966353 RepID=UPI00261175FF|nr:UbiA family prenyltransferase [Haloactinopolyspora sp.]
MCAAATVGRTTLALARAAHAGPTAAVTIVAVLLAQNAGNDAATIGVVLVAVLAGQLSIGWSNDLLDARRDRAAGRRDKPVATGELPGGLVRVGIAVALTGCVVASMSLGAAAGSVHLALVGCGWAYNALLKRTVWSWLPYAVAFGGLPVVATLALDPPSLPPWWMVVAGSLLGIGAHMANAVPDLDEDIATGVVGLPHRLGRRGSLVVATGVLTAASAAVVAGPAGPVPGWAWAGLVLVVGLAALALASTGRTAFRAAVTIALLDVVMLVARG